MNILINVKEGNFDYYLFANMVKMSTFAPILEMDSDE
jgi:hypothetical protein